MTYTIDPKILDEMRTPTCMTREAAQAAADVLLRELVEKANNDTMRQVLRNHFAALAPPKSLAERVLEEMRGKEYPPDSAKAIQMVLDTADRLREPPQ